MGKLLENFGLGAMMAQVGAENISVTQEIPRAGVNGVCDSEGPSIRVIPTTNKFGGSPWLEKENKEAPTPQ